MSDEKLRMQAYYYGFSETGKRPIDLILSAVACAGKSYHSTEDWLNECQSWTHLRGNTPADWIQNAADDAAADYDALQARVVELDSLSMLSAKELGECMQQRDTALADLATAREECERLRGLLRRVLLALIPDKALASDQQKKLVVESASTILDDIRKELGV